VGPVKPKIVFLSIIGFKEMYCQSKDQHHESQSYVVVSLSINSECTNTYSTR